MNDQDRKKGRLSCIFYLLAFVLPLVGLIGGWVGWNFKTGILTSVLIFGVLFTLGSIFTIWIQTPSWTYVLLPAIVGQLYAIINFIPLPFDGVLVAIAGAIISSAIAWVKFADLPKWTLIPLIAAALYTIIGEFIPGPVDELIVGIIAIGIPAAYIIRTQPTKSPVSQPPQIPES